jgi:hypothetical protein
MGFSSQVGRGEIIIHDGNFNDEVTTAAPDGMSKGHIERDYEEVPLGTFGTKFALPIIPESETQARIEELVARKALISDLRKHYKIKSRNQNGTNYCWTHGVVTALICCRMRAGLPYLDLSPASVAAIIKQGRNQGGWGAEALRFIQQHGVADSSVWPHNNIRDWRELSQSASVIENRKQTVVTETLELRPRNLDEIRTCLLLGIPVAVGYNWWGHEVCAVDPLWLDGTFAYRIWNSWSDSWSDNGMGVIQGRKMLADDQVAPMVSMAA